MVSELWFFWTAISMTTPCFCLRWAGFFSLRKGKYIYIYGILTVTRSFPNWFRILQEVGMWYIAWRLKLCPTSDVWVSAMPVWREISSSDEEEKFWVYFQFGVNTPNSTLTHTLGPSLIAGEPFATGLGWNPKDVYQLRWCIPHNHRPLGIQYPTWFITYDNRWHFFGS